MGRVRASVGIALALILGYLLWQATGATADSLPTDPQVFVVARDGSALRQLTHNDRAHLAPVWSPDGDTIASISNGTRPMPGGAVPLPAELQLTAVDGSSDRSSRLPGSPLALSWRGRANLAVVTRRAVVVVGTDGQVRSSKSLGVTVHEAAWSADGQALAVATIGRRGPSRTIVRYLGDRRLVNRVAPPAFGLAWSPSADALLFGAGSSLWSVSRQGQAVRRLAAHLIIVLAAFSPSGSRVAVGAVTDNGDRRFHLYLLPRRGGTPRQVSGEIATQRPVWSPNGRAIAYVTTRHDAIETVRADGTGRQTITTMPGADIGSLTWSRDGRHLAFTAAKARPSD